MPQEVSALIASKVTSLDAATVPEATLHAARRCLVDALGCAAAGQHHPAVAAATRWAEQSFAAGASPVWFTTRGLSAIGAAFVNATATSILDLDDGHRVAAGHPGAAVIPSVLAEARLRKSSFDEILLAIIAGYEVGIGCAAMRSAEAQATVATGRWSAIAVAAALAKLRGFDAATTQHALTIAEAHAPNLLAADHAGFRGGDVKEGIPWSVVTGFGAAGLAESGKQGYEASLGNPGMYRAWDGDVVFGGKSFFIDNTYFKRYACCRWIHSAIDAAIDLKRELPAGASLLSISVETFRRAATLTNLRQPADLISAQFSVPFAIAVGLERGADALLPMHADVLADPAILRTASKVNVSIDPDLDAMYPLKVPARVHLESTHGSSSKLVVSPVGDYDNPMSDAALIDKAIHLASRSRVELARPQMQSLLSRTCAAEELHDAFSAGTVR
jgi:2-methylcitrate dehydratase PrpD